MPTRREFIHGAASAAGSVAFLSCDLLDARHAHAEGAPRRREVVVSGKRVKTVDIHAHCAFPDPCHGGIEGRSRGARPDRAAHPADGRARHRRRGAQHQSGLVQGRARRRRKANRAPNEKLAELCAKHPDRFVAFATVAMQYPDLAVQQLEYGVKKLGLRGMSVGTHVNGVELCRSEIPSDLGQGEELGILVFMHPVAMAHSSRASAAMAGWSTSSAIRSTPRSRSRT